MWCSCSKRAPAPPHPTPPPPTHLHHQRQPRVAAPPLQRLDRALHLVNVQVELRERRVGARVGPSAHRPPPNPPPRHSPTPFGGPAPPQPLRWGVAGTPGRRGPPGRPWRGTGPPPARELGGGLGVTVRFWRPLHTPRPPATGGAAPAAGAPAARARKPPNFNSPAPAWGPLARTLRPRAGAPCVKPQSFRAAAGAAPRHPARNTCAHAGARGQQRATWLACACELCGWGCRERRKQRGRAATRVRVMGGAAQPKVLMRRARQPSPLPSLVLQAGGAVVEGRVLLLPVSLAVARAWRMGRKALAGLFNLSPLVGPNSSRARRKKDAAAAVAAVPQGARLSLAGAVCARSPASPN